MFATHFHELTEMARVLPNVVNLHVTAQLAAGGGAASSSSSSASSSSQQQEAAAAAAERLILLYKVAPGACDQSFGVQVAGLSRFPQPVVRLAHRKLEQLEQLGSAAGARLRQGKRKAPAEDDDADSGSHRESAGLWTMRLAWWFPRWGR
jgi:DNA mismatch repair ATPase MutS